MSPEAKQAQLALHSKLLIKRGRPGFQTTKAPSFACARKSFTNTHSCRTFGEALRASASSSAPTNSLQGFMSTANSGDFPSFAAASSPVSSTVSYVHKQSATAPCSKA